MDSEGLIDVGLRTRLQEILPGESVKLPTREAANEAAQKFEALFLRTIIRDMRKSAEAFGEGMFGKSVGAGIRESWFDNMMAAHLSKSGQLGLADAIVQDWDRWGLIGKEKSGEQQ